MRLEPQRTSPHSFFGLQLPSKLRIAFSFLVLRPLRSIRGRIGRGEAILLVMIVVNLAYIAHLLIQRPRGREAQTILPVVAAGNSDQSRVALEPRLETHFSRSIWIDEWLGQVTPPTELEWSKALLSQSGQLLTSQIRQESPGCSTSTRVSGPQVYWVLHPNSARQFEQGRLFHLNPTSGKCFVKGDEGEIFFFPFDSNLPVISKLGRARVEYILALTFEAFASDLQQYLNLPMNHFLTALNFPNRKPKHESTLVQLSRISSPDTPKGLNEDLETPLVLPRFRRVTQAWANTFAQSLNTASGEKKNVLFVDFRPPQSQATSWLAVQEQRLKSRIAQSTGQFEWADPRLPPSSRFSWSITYKQIEEAQLNIKFPVEYNSESTTLVFVGQDEFDARPFWAILKLIPEHPLSNIVWARQGETDVVNIISEIRGQLSNAR